MKPAYLYELEFPNGRKYIGITNNFEDRWRHHIGSARRGHTFVVSKAIRKYSHKSVKRKILLIGTMEYVAEMEVRAIAVFGTLVPSGYNICAGGQTPPSKSLQARKKISDALKRRWEEPAFRKNISEKNKAYKHTEEQKKKNSESRKALWKNPEYRQKCIDSHKGNKHSEETKAKMSASRMGHPNYNYRIMQTNEKGQFVKALPKE